MGTFIAKIEGNDNTFLKLKDQVEHRAYNEINLSEAIIYDPNNTMAHQWFKITNFSENNSFMNVFCDNFDAANLVSINRDNYSNIEFIAFYSEGKYYIQKVTNSTYLTKNMISLTGDIVNYETRSNAIFINNVPNCIYDVTIDCLFFMDISKAYAIFKHLKNDFKEATNDEVQTFLDLDLIDCIDFNVDKVGITNRKTISRLLSIYNNYTLDQKQTLKAYIKESLGDVLVYNQENQKFSINKDCELRLLLYGIQQRFYRPPLNSEVQVATNTTKVSNLI